MKKREVTVNTEVVTFNTTSVPLVFFCVCFFISATTLRRCHDIAEVDHSTPQAALFCLLGGGRRSCLVILFVSFQAGSMMETVAFIERLSVRRADFLGEIS